MGDAPLPQAGAGHPPSLLSSPFQLPARAGLQNRPVGITMLSAQVVAARGSCAEHSAKCSDRQRLQTVMAILLTHDGYFEDLKPLCAKKTKRKKEKSRSSSKLVTVHLLHDMCNVNYTIYIPFTIL